jgi:hypothetical protein
MKKIFTLILSLALLQAFGQDIPMQVISSSGGYSTTTNYSISWTLGEPVISTLTSGNLMLTQGFQQGNLFGTDVPNPDFNHFKFKMYPNPAINKVYFEVDNQEAKGSFIVEIYDVTGRKMMNENLGVFNNQELKDLSVTTLKAGIYFVKVKIGSFNSDVIKLVKE